MWHSEEEETVCTCRSHAYLLHQALGSEGYRAARTRNRRAEAKGYSLSQRTPAKREGGRKRISLHLFPVCQMPSGQEMSSGKYHPESGREGVGDEEEETRGTRRRPHCSTSTTHVRPEKTPSGEAHANTAARIPTETESAASRRSVAFPAAHVLFTLHYVNYV